MEKQAHSTDIAIVGGGMGGLVMALALSTLSYRVTLIEQRDPKALTQNSDTPKDGRASAYAPAAKAFLKKYGIWEHLENYASPIQEIRVVDNHSPFFLHFGEDTKEEAEEPLGYMIMNDPALKTLWNHVLVADHVTTLSKCRVESFEAGPNEATLQLSDGNTVKARLVIAADGRLSHLRTLAGIPVTEHDYKQTALIGVVHHEKPHGCVAVEHFFPEGPFASLPLEGGHHSGLVWTEKPEQAAILMTFSPEDQLSFLQDKFGDHWGDIQLTTPLKSYPLRLSFAREYHSHRLLLLGDAAHAIHPLAGQGFNLAVRDMNVLMALFEECQHLGIDIADSHLGERYTEERRMDNMLMIALTHACNAAYSNDFLPLKAARRLLMRGLHYAKPLKKTLQHFAMGKRNET